MEIQQRMKKSWREQKHYIERIVGHEEECNG